MRVAQPGRAVRTEQVDIDGLSLRAAVWPAQSSHPPLLLFNGLGGNLELMQPFIDALQGIEVACFDMPGVGGSGLARRPYRLRTMARLAARVAVRLGYGDVDVLGVSWGGAVAQEFARRNRTRCRRLVLCATTAGALGSLPGSPRVLAAMLSPRRYHDPGYMEREAGRIYGGKFRTDPELVRQHAARVRWPSTAGYWLQLFAMMGWSSLPWLWRLPQPTLVIAGADDPIVRPINGRILARCIPHARLEMIDDGHLFLVSSPERSAALVREFLGSTC